MKLKHFLFVSLFALSVLAACSSEDEEPTDNNGKPEELDVDLVGEGVCPVGFVDFAHPGINIRFCYPEEMIVQTMTKDGISTVYIGDEAGIVYAEMKVMPWESVANPPEPATVQSYGVFDGTLACEVESRELEMTTLYSIVGGDLETTTACRNTELYSTALTQLPLEYFVFYKDDATTYVLLSGSQEAYFGTDTEEVFLRSIQPIEVPEEPEGDVEVDVMPEEVPAE